MLRTMLQAKLHRVRVTEADLHYEGSATIDAELLAAADILPYERVDIWNVTNGERFSTYAIKGERGSGMISLNGAAARKAQKGDLVIIAAYGMVEDKELKSFKPKLVFVDEQNKNIEERGHIPTQMM